MTYTTRMGDGLKRGDFVRVRARGLHLNETGVVTRVYHGVGFGLVHVLFSNGTETSFRLGEIEFIEREV